MLRTGESFSDYAALVDDGPCVTTDEQLRDERIERETNRLLADREFQRDLLCEMLETNADDFRVTMAEAFLGNALSRRAIQLKIAHACLQMAEAKEDKGVLQ